MAFSLRSFFGKGGSSDSAAATLPPTPPPPHDAAVTPPAPAADPAFPNMLFKTAAPSAPPLGQPVAPSPFAVAGPPPVAALTIGDLLPAIPGDVAKNPGLPPTHPVTIPDLVMENALRSGRAALPLFEVFRACPAMFQVQVGPHDPREVPLPPHKIAHLIPGQRPGSAPPAAGPMTSPFAPSAMPGSASPFGIAPSAAPPAAAPPFQQTPASPLFQPSPFGIPTEPHAPAQPGGGAPQDHAPGLSSPFGIAPGSGGPPPAASPFTTAPAMTVSSPFGAAPPQTPSPFGAAPPQPEAAAGGPFAAASPAGTQLPPVPFVFGSAPTAPPAPPQEAAAKPDWSSIFAPQHTTPPTAPASSPEPLPGVGATLFPGANQAPAPTHPADGSAGGTPSFLAPPPAPEASPFPSAPAKPANPFERIQSLGMALMAAPGQTPAQPPPAYGGTLEKPPEPFTPAPSPYSDSLSAYSRKEIKLSLAAAVRNCPAHDLGTNPENIPAWVQFTLPYDMIAEQLGSGRVTVPLDAIVGGLDAPIRALFAQARAGYQVELPANEVFHAVSEIPAPPAAPAAQPAGSHGDAASLDLFAPKPDSPLQEPRPLQPAAAPSWNDPTGTSGGIPPGLFGGPPAGFGTIPPAERGSDLPPSAGAIHVKPKAVVIPANPATGAPEFVTPPPVVASPGSFSAVATPRADNATRRLLLTVLLGSPEASDVTAIVELTRRLPGVAAALCVHQGRAVAECGDASAEADRFLRDAPAKIAGLAALAALTGIEDTETLNIQSGQGEATFCLQGDVTFAVLHDPRNREPALKEKITLLGREVAAILHESAAR